MNKKFWNWESESESRVLEIYGTIAEDSWFDDDVTPVEFRKELFSGTGPVTIWINSPGGDCIAASQIYSMLMDYKDDVTVKIDGIAASAASVIAMAGTKVLMAPTSMLMIHNPATMAFGDHNEMEKAIEMLKEVKESIINAYEIKTGLDRKEISKLMESETWMNAKKAIEMGFADGEIVDEKKSGVKAAYSFSGRDLEVKLINKMTAKVEKDEKEIQPELPIKEPEEETKETKPETAKPEETKEEMGSKLSDLNKRLSLLKP